MLLKRISNACRCYQDGRFEQAVGVALETRRLDKLEEAIGKSGDTAATLVYALRVCQELVVHRGFRQQVLPCPPPKPLQPLRLGASAIRTLYHFWLRQFQSSGQV